MNAKKIFLLVCFILCLHCTANAQDNVVENWCDNNMLIAEGYGFPKENAENPRRAQILARRAAIMDGYRQLAEQAKEILSLREIAEYISSLADKKVVFEIPSETQAKGFSKAVNGIMTNAKLRDLGWTPKDDTRSGVKKTIEILKSIIQVRS